MNAFKSFALSLWREWIRQIGAEKAADYLTRIAQLIEEGEGRAALEIEHGYHKDFLSKIDSPI